MKRFKGSPKDVISPDLVGEVTLRYVREHKHRRAARRIAENPGSFIAKLYRDLTDGTYAHEPLRRKVVGGRGEKVRVIMMPTVRDAIAAAVVYEALEPWWNARLYPDTYCNRRGMGGTRLFRRLRRFVMRKQPKYVLKCDVRKCFDSIPHDEARRVLRRLIKRADMRELVEKIGSIKAGAVGIPIGNGLSHHVANGVLSGVYAQVRRLASVLRCAAYMDDFVVFSNNKRKLHRARVSAGEILAGVGLALKGNWQIYDVALEGVDIVGYHFWPDGHVRLRRKIYYRARRARNPKRCASYYGFAKHARDFALMDQLKRRIGK